MNAYQVVSPLISLEARDLMDNCLSSKEMEIWMSMGDTWRTPPLVIFLYIHTLKNRDGMAYADLRILPINIFFSEDWTAPLPQAYRPLFADGFAPYGSPEPIAPTNVHPQFSTSTLHNHNQV